MKIILVRHVETEANKKKIFSGKLDYPITKHGREQIKELKKQLKSINIDIIISSPLKRAYYTAIEISKVLNKTVITNDKIREINFGKFEGKNIEEIKKNILKNIKNGLGIIKIIVFLMENVIKLSMKE
nr:histidine phosphatase family protein [Marinitoga lauensis]